MPLVICTDCHGPVSAMRAAPLLVLVAACSGRATVAPPDAGKVGVSLSQHSASGAYSAGSSEAASSAYVTHGSTAATSASMSSLGSSTSLTSASSAGVDAGHDATVDAAPPVDAWTASPDVGADAGRDATPDSGVDANLPPDECVAPGYSDKSFPGWPELVQVDMGVYFTKLSYVAEAQIATPACAALIGGAQGLGAPTLAELQSLLLNRAGCVPDIDQVVFPDTSATEVYWSSDIIETDGGYVVMGLDFGTGATVAGNLTDMGLVRCYTGVTM